MNRTPTHNVAIAVWLLTAVAGCGRVNFRAGVDAGRGADSSSASDARVAADVGMDSQPDAVPMIDAPAEAGVDANVLDVRALDAAVVEASAPGDAVDPGTLADGAEDVLDSRGDVRVVADVPIDAAPRLIEYPSDGTVIRDGFLRIGGACMDGANLLVSGGNLFSNVICAGGRWEVSVQDFFEPEQLGVTSVRLQVSEIPTSRFEVVFIDVDAFFYVSDPIIPHKNFPTDVLNDYRTREAYFDVAAVCEPGGFLDVQRDGVAVVSAACNGQLSVRVPLLASSHAIQMTGMNAARTASRVVNMTVERDTSVGGFNRYVITSPDNTAEAYATIDFGNTPDGVMFFSDAGCTDLIGFHGIRGSCTALPNQSTRVYLPNVGSPTSIFGMTVDDVGNTGACEPVGTRTRTIGGPSMTLRCDDFVAADETTTAFGARVASGIDGDANGLSVLCLGSGVRLTDPGAGAQNWSPTSRPVLVYAPGGAVIEGPVVALDREKEVSFVGGAGAANVLLFESALSIGLMPTLANVRMEAPGRVSTGSQSLSVGNLGHAQNITMVPNTVGGRPLLQTNGGVVHTIETSFVLQPLVATAISNFRDNVAYSAAPTSTGQLGFLFVTWIGTVSNNWFMFPGGAPRTFFPFLNDRAGVLSAWTRSQAQRCQIGTLPFVVGTVGSTGNRFCSRAGLLPVADLVRPVANSRSGGPTGFPIPPTRPNSAGVPFTVIGTAAFPWGDPTTSGNPGWNLQAQWGGECPAVPPIPVP